MELEPFSLELRSPLSTAAGSIGRREGFLVRVEREGFVGIGEATPLPGWTESYEECADALAAADLAGTLIVFLGSLRYDNSSPYDPYWSVAPMAIAGWLFWTGDPVRSIRPTIVLLFVWAWGARLTWNWARGWRGLGHEDWRYAAYRLRLGPLTYWGLSLLGFHLFPTMLVYLGSLALFPALGGGGTPFGPLDAAAAVVTLTAILLEAVADRQLRRFTSASGREPAAILDTGLWRYSRHPNYFGEVLFWWGLWLFGFAAEPAWWWAAVGPIAITLLFLVISIPMMERRMLARRPGYMAQIRRRSRLVPWPPRS
jgi:steroid 5-alpha reductase family enzyme